ncbi:hypothetical protein scyTo_0023508, partial [Scyliorhinus torazame]|nr:hypothetical protein [Scyliorhinus torazame]
KDTAFPRVRWMMYWIVFAIFTSIETFTDIFISWFPFYYEIKVAFVVWLLSPYTKGASMIYRKFIHPTLSSKEKLKLTFQSCQYITGAFKD